MIKLATNFIKNHPGKLLLIVLPLLLLLGVLTTSSPQVSAQAGGSGDGEKLCYSIDQRINKPTTFPVCNYDGLKALGFDMGSLPNPFPSGKHCYYFPATGGGNEVNCEDPLFKNAPEYGSSTPPPLTAKCYTGEAGNEGQQIYRKVDCTADYQSQLGSALQSNKCYLVDVFRSGNPYKGETACDGPAAQEGNQRAAEGKNTQPVGTGTVTPGTPGACPKVQTSFFGLPTWYKYLEVGENCAVKLDLVNNPNQIWLIALAIADILLWVAGFVAVLFVIYGGYRYITSQFDPEGTKNARDTILNALIGLTVAVLAAALVNFVGRTLS